ncbi:MAG: hypothetical protein ABIQ88_19745 [Chitinophagaceae bacterium]
MNKYFLSIAAACIIIGAAACNNSDQTPARAGTSDSAGTGDAVGKGTPYAGGDSASPYPGRDSINAVRPADSVNKPQH